MIDEFTAKVTARAVHEGDASFMHDAKIANPRLVMNMSERMEYWFDSLLNMPRQRL